MIKWDKVRVCDNCEKTSTNYKGESFTITFASAHKKLKLCQECLIELEKEIKMARRDFGF